MVRDDDEFEGIDIGGPWGGIRIGQGGVRMGRRYYDGDDEERRARRHVRRRLRFFRHASTFVVVVGFLALMDWATGGGWWVQWLAAIWGAFLALEFVGTFIGPTLWSSETEDRMVAREIERRRGRVHVEPPPPRDE